MQVRRKTPRSSVLGLGFLFRVEILFPSSIAKRCLQYCTLHGNGFVAQARFMSRCLVGAITAISLCMQIVRGWDMSRDLKSGGTTRLDHPTANQAAGPRATRRPTSTSIAFGEEGNPPITSCARESVQHMRSPRPTTPQTHTDLIFNTTAPCMHPELEVCFPHTLIIFQ